MKQVINIITTAFVAVLFSTFGMIGHASAMPAEMHGSSTHHKTTPTNCATICLSTPINKDRNQPDHHEQDNEPEEPYYLQFASVHTGWLSEKKFATRTIDPPEKVPKYRLCCVIRR